MGLFGKKAAAENNGRDTIKKAEDAAAAFVAADDQNDELIAVIAAAISAYGAEQYKQTLYIRKLNRTAGVRPAWGVTGTNEAIDTRRM